MPETKPNEKITAATPLIPTRSPSGPPAAGRQPQHHPVPEATKAPASIPEIDTIPEASKPAADATKPLAAQPRQSTKGPIRPNFIWIVLPIAILLAILAFLIVRPRPKAAGTAREAVAPTVEINPELSNYSAFVEKNKALFAGYSEQILSDEPFAGNVPLACRAGGPVISSEIDPQMAALADALRIRVQVTQGSQSLARGNTVTRATRGEFRGFKVQAVEKFENGKVISEETIVTTPRNGIVKTVGRVLASLQKTDQAGLLAEVSAAGMEYSPLPAHAGEKNFRGQLRLLNYWGRPIPDDRLISGEGVGRVFLRMPLALLKSRLAATDSVLKRKVLINDVYHDVYKVMDQRNNPLFFVYEKEGKVQGIRVVSEDFRTGRGIGISNSLDQIRIHYPIITQLRSEKKLPFVKVEGVAGILILEDEGDKKVVAILIGDSPEFN